MNGFCSVVLIDAAISHLDRSFTYADPEGATQIGSLVRVPFRGKRRPAVVVDLLDEPDVAKTLPIAGVVGPGIGADAVDLARWIAGRYLSTLGEAAAAVVPQRVASEEQHLPDIPRRPAAALDIGLRDYPKAEQLRAALARGGGHIVWRPQSGGTRAETITAMAATAAAHGGVLVLVPEVRVSSDVADALDAHFGDALARLGSDRPARERYRDWLALRAGRKRVAIGSRAAVFAPIENLALILMDDEGHQSYKEARAPRYHARTVAAERARRTGASFVLVGVPPSLEARAAAERKPYILVAPPRAAERAARPAVAVVDPGTLVPAATTLQMAKRALVEGNRVVFISHRLEGMSAVASRVRRILSPRRLAILDARSSAVDVVRAVRSADCMCATPFIAKDLTVSGVGLLALLDVDAALTQPEYRAVEDAFATWWRAGRWLAEGRIAIETSNGDHPAVVALTRWDPDVLYRAEAARRRELGYPPFASLARIDVPAERAAGVVEELSGAADIEILGPVEREGRTVVVARARSRAALLDALRPAVQRWRATDEPMRVDVDPWEVFIPKWRS